MKAHIPDDQIKCRVLLVDDQLMIHEALRRALAPADDIELFSCRRADEAMPMIKRVHPTCILQDLVMPDADGLDLVRAYRQDDQAVSIPVIVLSAREEPEIKSQAFALGANDYLVKLPDSIELIARIRYHSKMYIVQRQRDEAYRRLQESERRLALANRELQRLSVQDSLTGIANRRRFDEVLYQEWRRAMRNTSSLALIMLDIDFFKRYNDLYGHQQGDECLRRVAGIIRSSVRRESDTVARYGGEEFAVILPETGIHGAVDVAETIRANVFDAAIKHEASAVADRVTVSLGVSACVPEKNPDPKGLVAAADKALYLAKQEGRNRVKSFFELLIT